AGLVAATGFSLWQMRAARLERDAALRESRRADAQVEFQNALLTQVGDKSITMRQALDSARVVLEHQYSASPSLRVSMLLQLAGSYAQLGVTGIRATLLTRAESLALAGLGADQLPEIRCAMADNLRTQGRYDEAWRTLNAVAPLLRSAPGPGNETACLAVRSLLASETGRAEEGAAAARRAIAIRDSLGKTRDLLYLDLLKTHALALGAGDRHRDAVAAHRRAIAAADSSGRGGTLSRAIMQHDLALSLLELGETAEAERILRTVLGLAIQSDPTGRVHPQPLVHYAETALTQDRADSARKYFGLLVTQADTNLYWEGRGLFGLARAEIRLGRVAEARRAKARLEQIIARYPHVRNTDDQVPDGRTIDGWLALAGRNPAAAKTHFVAALRSNGWFEGKRRKRLRPVALLAARSALAVGDVEEALALAREAHAVAALDSLAEIRSAYVGEARLVEGRALLARGDTMEGDAAIARALTALRHGAGSEHPLTREAEALAAELRR
ncbi:MAG: hypothetical protein H0V43_09605, partial [Gemmatimonadales bacterium]|nr:hypothetical protein [Gemmatimonadales bacterium]